MKKTKKSWIRRHPDALMLVGVICMLGFMGYWVWTAANANEKTDWGIVESIRVSSSNPRYTYEIEIRVDNGEVIRLGVFASDHDELFNLDVDDLIEFRWNYVEMFMDDFKLLEKAGWRVDAERGLP